MCYGSKIMIGCPLSRNREFVLTDYLNAIKNLNYNKKDISLCFLLNGYPEDKTEKILEIFQDEYENEYNRFDIWKLNNDNKDRRTGSRDYGWFALIRNLWTQMKTDEDYLFSVDSDIILKEETLNNLLATQKDIISALICNSLDNTMPYKLYNIHRFSDSKSHIIPLMPNELKGPIASVDVTGACYLIKSNILDLIKYSYDKYGEDIGFCKEAEKYKIKRFCLLTEELTHKMTKET